MRGIMDYFQLVLQVIIQNYYFEYLTMALECLDSVIHTIALCNLFL